MVTNSGKVGPSPSPSLRVRSWVRGLRVLLTIKDALGRLSVAATEMKVVGASA